MILFYAMFPVNLDIFDGKSVLVTGGTGSFGQRCVKRLLESRAKRIVIFSRDELKQHQMQTSISDPDGRLRFFIGDVRDLGRLELAFRGVDFVIHAAALKQVPALEYNPFEAVKTNVLGTQNVIQAALDNEVEKVILVSTDKAANPANLYGATKLCAEKLVMSANYYSAGRTKFSVVRYGNVFGSRGSIIQLLEEQKKKGEVLLTHEEMTRFWITLDQGIDLVFFALSTMGGGEIYIPKIPSMKMKVLLSLMAPETPIRVIGIRPGEKIHEVLVTPEEARHAKEYDTHYIIYPHHAQVEKKQSEGGKDVEDGFYFSSHNNTWWLDEEGLKKLMESI